VAIGIIIAAASRIRANITTLNEIGNDGARDAAGTLDNNVEQHLAPRHLAARREDKCYRRIEVRPRNRAKNGDDHNQDRTCRYGVSEQRNSLITARQPPGFSRSWRRTGSAGSKALSLFNPSRRRTRLTVAGETQVSAAICLPVQRWRRSRSISSKIA